MRTLAAFPAILLTVLLTGCGSSSHSASPPSSSTSTTSTVSTTSTTSSVATTSPPTSTAPASTTPATTVPPPGYTTATQQWEQGAKSIAAGQSGYWDRAAADLRGGLSSGAAGTSGYAAAIQELQGLAAIPETSDTPAQMAEAQSDSLALNLFFGTDGLYGWSSPSGSLAQFVSTLQQEIRLGTFTGVLTAPSPSATVTCPILTSLAVGADFGCEVSPPMSGSALLIGEMAVANGVSFGTFTAPFQCDVLDAGEQTVLDHLGGACS